MAPKIRLGLGDLDLPRLNVAKGLAAESFENPQAKMVLEDLLREQPELGSVFGPNSLSVKKDLYKKAQSPLDIRNLLDPGVLSPREVDAINEGIKTDRRYGDYSPEGRVSLTHTDPSSVNRVVSNNPSPRGNTRKVISPDLGPSHSGAVWKNLMDDPAFPLAAGATGAALLGASSAQADEFDPNDAINETSPTTPKSMAPASQPASAGGFDPDEAVLDASQEGASEIPLVAPMGQDTPSLPYEQSPLKSVLPPLDLGPNQSPATYEPPTPEVTGWAKVAEVAAQAKSPGLLAIQGALWAEENIANPVVDYFQRTQGRPQLETAIDAAKRLEAFSAATTGVAVQDGEGEAAEYLARAAGTLIAGQQQFLDYVDNPAGRKGVAYLEDIFGAWRAAWITSIAKSMGDIPLMALTPAAKTVQGAVALGVLGGLVDPQQSIVEGAVTGGGLFGAFRSIKAVGGPTRQLAKWLADTALPQLDPVIPSVAPVKPATVTKFLPRGPRPKIAIIDSDSATALFDELGNYTLPESTLAKADEGLASYFDNLNKLATALDGIQNKTTPTYKVNTPVGMKPVGPIRVSVVSDVNGKPTFLATMLEVGPNGVGRWSGAIEDINDASSLRSLLDKHHPEIEVNISHDAQAAMGQPMTKALWIQANKLKPAKELVNMGETLPGGTPRADIPKGNPPAGPKLMVVHDNGFLSLYDLKSKKGMKESLLGRGIVKVITPKGPRYASVYKLPKDGFVEIQPFDIKEGVPTILRVSRVPVGQVSTPSDKELGRLVTEAAFTRDSIRAGANAQPDVHVEPPSTSGILPAQSGNTIVPGANTTPGGGALRAGPYNQTVQQNFMQQKIAALTQQNALLRQQQGLPTATPPAAPAGPPAPPAAPPRVPVPMPPAPPPGAPGSPNGPTPLALVPTYTLAGTLKKKLGNGYEKAHRLLVHGGIRSDFDFATVVNDLTNTGHLKDAQIKHQQALEQALPFGSNKAKISKYREDVYAWMTGKLNEQDLVARYPEAYNATKQILLDYRNKVNANHDRLVRLGAIPPKEGSDAMDWKHAVRSYGLQTLAPNKRLEIFEKDTQGIQDAVIGFQAWSSNNKNKTLSDDDALVKLREALISDDPEMSLFGKEPKKPGQDAIGSLKKRLDLPVWYRKFLGENTDGFFVASKTLATQEELIAIHSVWDKLSSNPNYIRDTANGLPVGHGWRLLEDNRYLYGKAAGKLVAPEVYDNLVTLPNINYTSNNKIVQALVTLQKINWFGYGKFRTYMNTLVDNWIFGLTSGGLDPITSPKQAGEAMGSVWKSMYEYSRNPEAQNDGAQFMRDARRIGPYETGHFGAAADMIARRQEQHFIRQIANKPWKDWEYGDVLLAMSDGYKQLSRPGSWMFEFADNTHRLASWKILTDKFMENPSVLPQLHAKLIGALPSSGVTDRELAMRLATFRVLQYYPSPSHAAPAARFMAESAIGVASPTARFGMEHNRVLGSLPFRLIDDPGLKWRLLKLGAVGYAAFNANGWLRTAFGEVSDEEAKAATQTGNKAQRWWQPGLWVAPIKYKGQLVVMDFTPWSGPLQYLAGDPELGPLANMFMTAVTRPLSGGMGGTVVEGLQQAAGMNVPYQSRPSLPGTNPVLNVGERLARGGMAPAIIPEVYDNLNKSDYFGTTPNRKQEQWPIELSTARTLGAPISAVPSTGQDNNPTFQAAISERVGKVKQLEGLFAQVAQQPVDKRLPMLYQMQQSLMGSTSMDKDILIQSVVQEIKKTLLEIKEVAEAEKAARNSHPRRIGSDSGLSEPSKPPRRIGVDK